ncbi:MAG: DUF2953 domain-containing protein [Ruminococcus sp.]|nr:DUF2953 domain-containing protein [Ruminococcus sp.]
MLALYIILGVLLLLFLLTLFNIWVYFVYDESPSLVVKAAFLKFQILPPKPKKKKKKKQKQKEKPKEKKQKKPEKKEKSSFDLKAYVKQKGISGLVNIFKRVAKLASGILKGLFRHLHVTELKILLKIAGEDSADAGEKYGKVCAVFFPALRAIMQVVNIEDYDVSVDPDFTADAVNRAYAVVTARIRIIFILTTVLSKAFAALMLFLKAKPKKQKKNPPKTDKDRR